MPLDLLKRRGDKLGLARSSIEVVEPLALEFAEAAPAIQRPEQAMQWINADHDRSPVERQAPSGGSGGLVCAHCGFGCAHERAFYCPRCGMRMARG